MLQPDRLAIDLRAEARDDAALLQLLHADCGRPCARCAPARRACGPTAVRRGSARRRCVDRCCRARRSGAVVCWVIVVLVAHAQRSGCDARARRSEARIGACRTTRGSSGQTTAIAAEPRIRRAARSRRPPEPVGVADRGRQERRGDEPHRRQQGRALRTEAPGCPESSDARDRARLVADVRGRSERCCPPRVELGARSRASPARARLQAEAQRGVPPHDRVGGRRVERSPEPLLQLERDRRAASRPPSVARRHRRRCTPDRPARRRRRARARGLAFTARTAASRRCSSSPNPTAYT